MGRKTATWSLFVWMLLGVPVRSGADTPLSGEWVSVSCVHGRVEAFDGKLQLAQQIDSLTLYGADEPPWPIVRGQPRDPMLGSGLLGKYGRECAGAKNRDACRVRVASASNRDAKCRSTGVCSGYAVLTSGDRVWRIEQPSEMRVLLQLPIDSSAELLLMAALAGLPFRCEQPCHRERVSTQLRALEDGLGFEVRSPNCNGCDPEYDKVDVSSAGVVSNLVIQQYSNCRLH